MAVRTESLLPHPGTSVSIAGAFGALAILGLLFYVGLRTARGRPHVAVGVFWYLVTLLPVIGLVQVGLQARADRYTYVPLIGPFIAIAWEAAILVGASARRRVAAGVVAAAVIVALGVTARAQVDRWSDETSLWTQALDENPDNFYAHYSLGWIHLRAGRLDAAMPHLERAIALAPWFASAHDAIGLALARQGRIDAAIDAHERALRLQPESTEARANLGLAYEQRGDVARAIGLYREALGAIPDGHRCTSASATRSAASVTQRRRSRRSARRSVSNLTRPRRTPISRDSSRTRDSRTRRSPSSSRARPRTAREDAHSLLGTLLLERDQVDAAIVHLGEAVRLQPDSPTSRSALGAALAAKGLLDGAIVQYRRPSDSCRRMPTAAISSVSALRMREGGGRHRSVLGSGQAPAGSSSLPTSASAWRWRPLAT